jgi:hypothetical protein
LKTLSPSRVGPGATAGWIEDRGTGYTSQDISLALRCLAKRRKVVKSSDGGMVYWQPLTPEVEAQLRKRRTKFGDQKAT